MQDTPSPGSITYLTFELNLCKRRSIMLSETKRQSASGVLR